MMDIPSQPAVPSVELAFTSVRNVENDDEGSMLMKNKEKRQLAVRLLAANGPVPLNGLVHLSLQGCICHLRCPLTDEKMATNDAKRKINL
jgi:hypothetical protein